MQFVLLVFSQFFITLVMRMVMEIEPTRHRLVRARQQFAINKVLMSKRNSVSHELEAFEVAARVSAWGDIDLDYIKKKRENTKKKLLEE